MEGFCWGDQWGFCSLVVRKDFVGVKGGDFVHWCLGGILLGSLMGILFARGKEGFCWGEQWGFCSLVVRNTNSVLQLCVGIMYTYVLYRG